LIAVVLVALPIALLSWILTREPTPEPPPTPRAEASDADVTSDVSDADIQNDTSDGDATGTSPDAELVPARDSSPGSREADQ